MLIVIKYLLTAAVIVLVSEIAKRNDQAGALVASLPLVTIMVLIWLHLEHQTTAKITNHAYYTFWYVIPTLPMFLVFGYLHQQLGFWPALGAGVIMTFVLFVLWGLLVRQFGIELF